MLAGELAMAQGDPSRAFAAYQSRLHRYVEDKQDSAIKFVSLFAARTKVGIWLRNAGMRAMNLAFVGDLVVSGALRDDIDLPDYPL